MFSVPFILSGIENMLLAMPYFGLSQVKNTILKRQDVSKFDPISWLCLFESIHSEMD